MEKKYYIGFFKYEDSKVWMRSHLSLDEKELYDYLNNVEYVDKKTIQIREIILPD